MIVGDEDCVQRESVSANHDIEVPHRLALAFQRGPKLAVLLGRIGIPRYDCYAQKEILDQVVQAPRMGKARSSEAQLPFSDGGYGELRHGNFQQMTINSRIVPLDDAARDIGVEQEAGHLDCVIGIWPN